MDKVYKYQLLLGDFVSYEVGSTSINIKSGYVIGICNAFYTIIDLDNSNIYREHIEDIEIVDNELTTTVIRSIKATNIKISRKLRCSSDYICKNLCKGLKDFPDACEDICPNRPLSNQYRTYLPGDIIGNGVIVSVSLVSEEINVSYINDYWNTELSEFDIIFIKLRGALPKPNPPFKDQSMDGVREILDNPEKYKLYERVYYKYAVTDNEGVPHLNPYQVDINELLKYKIVSKSYFLPNPKTSLCNYCIYNKETCKSLNCKLNILNKENKKL